MKCRFAKLVIMALVNVLFDFYIVERKFTTIHSLGCVLVLPLNFYELFVDTPMRQSLAVKQ